MNDASVENAFRYCVEGDLKYSPTFWFWWHVSEWWARTQEGAWLLKQTLRRR